MTRDLDWFWNGFEEIADAPNGVARLRGLILSLAVQGRLVPQDAGDEPASALLGRIKEEKARLVKAGKIRKSEPLAPVSEDEAPFELPESWAWVRLGTLLLSVIGGGTPSKINPSFWNGEILWASVKDLGKSKYLNQTIDRITDEGLKNSSSNLIPSGRVVVCTRMGLGKISITQTSIAINQDLKALELVSSVDLDYFYNFYKTLNLIGSGVTVSGIKQEELLNIFVPLPPLAEQKRIVAKVDELMALCDELDARQKQKHAGRALALGATLHRLQQATDADEFALRLATLADHFEELLDAPESVAPLRAAILGLAVQGKLEPQDEGDEPASVLLQHIAREKARLVAQKKIRKSEPLPPIGEDEAPFEIPASWAWVRLGEIIVLISGQHLNPEEQNISSQGLPYLTGPADFGAKNPTETRWTTQPKTTALCSDILLTVKGAGVGKINILAMTEAAIGRQLMAIRPYEVSLEYVYLFIQGAYYQFQNLSFGMTVPGIGREDILGLLFPLPPLAEQKRIVARVDELMALCDELGAGLRARHEGGAALVDAAVRRVGA